jgi:hypothetical protein
VKKADRKPLREGPAPTLHHTGKFRCLDEQKGRAKHARLSEPATVWSMRRTIV